MPTLADLFRLMPPVQPTPTQTMAGLYQTPPLSRPSPPAPLGFMSPYVNALVDVVRGSTVGARGPEDSPFAKGAELTMAAVPMLGGTKTLKRVVAGKKALQPSGRGIVHNASGRTQKMDVIAIPLEELEHGESAMPGGKLTWPGAEKLIEEYANRPTPFPPIDAIPPEFPGEKWLIEDGSHRVEAAKLRGDKMILVNVAP